MMTGKRVPLAIAALLALSACGIFKGGQKKTPVLGDRVPILLSESASEPDKTIAAVQVLLPPPAVNDSWAQPGGNSAKSMGQLALGESLSRAWSASVNGGSNRQRLAAPPVVAGGRLYAMDVDATVSAFAADTGAKIWSKTIAKENTNKAARFGGGVSFEDGKLYATDGVGDVVALNAADGTELWRAKPGGPLRGAPTIANGNLYVLSQDNQLFAIALADGTVGWTQSGSLESQGVFGVAAPAAAQGSVVAGFSSGELNAYRYENGRALWQDALSRSAISTSVSSLADIDAAPVIDQGRVYAVGQGGRTVAIDLATGQRVWAQNFAGISTPWIAGEWLFLITDDARLVCLTRSTGLVRWISQLPAYKNVKKRKHPITWFGPLLAGNRLVLTNSEGEIVSASVSNGEVQSTIKGGASISLPPIVANNTLYVLDMKGRITAYR
ncbi:PQQ-binding-like beta-propeller repeat protein [Sphingomonas sp. So64.6b]|uniref:PQQ-like beta-propeller repeat protein n=1 Tax=Sphingomonas sp. So64.6b TaxID=2997354 RepID=UPI0016039154|nr:PQQ-like beta-propeller repeat protein [Sphingomonas sp. So64.6b]QNA84672.1 PQQ-binding-like beta-propeller repeat protein [Sphingomonas sp. So64.6b]